MKSKFQVSILAALAAALMPLAIAGQVAPERTPSAKPESAYKWQAFALGSYTSLNQVNQSRYGLLGGKAGVTRDFGKYFGLTGIASYYKPPTGSGDGGNPGDPSVYTALAGPEFHTTIYGNFDGILHGLLGIEHTGGEHMTPNISFAGGFGGGLVYNLSRHWALRASGDKIGASFSLRDNSALLGYSPHRHWNASGDIGVVYRF